MRDTAKGRLPAPHDCIEVSVSHWYGDEWHVRYTGTPQQLVSAGIVDADMERKIRSRQGGQRFGTDGYEFKIERGRMTAREVWELGQPLTLKKKVRRKRGMKMPVGMRELFPNGLPSQQDLDDDIRKNPGPGDRVCGSLSVQACVYAEAVGRVVSRARAVGRLQRLMRWSVIGDDVIAPDWSWMIKQRLAGGAA